MFLLGGILNYIYNAISKNPTQSVLLFLSGCECDQYGSHGETCEQLTGQCDCKYNFQGLMCEKCKEGLYNYPNCEGKACDRSLL